MQSALRVATRLTIASGDFGSSRHTRSPRWHPAVFKVRASWVLEASSCA